MVAEWFINFELPLAISLISSIPLLGSFLNGLVTPRVSTFDKVSHNGEAVDYSQELGNSFRIGFFQCLASLVLVFALTCLDYRSQKHDS